MNRAARRALDKGALCLARRSKIPAGVRAKVGSALDDLAARRGLRVGPDRIARTMSDAR
jgi:hypothetical protein